MLVAYCCYFGRVYLLFKKYLIKVVCVYYKISLIKVSPKVFDASAIFRGPNNMSLCLDAGQHVAMHCIIFGYVHNFGSSILLGRTNIWTRWIEALIQQDSRKKERISLQKNSNYLTRRKAATFSASRRSRPQANMWGKSGKRSYH